MLAALHGHDARDREVDRRVGANAFIVDLVFGALFTTEIREAIWLNRLLDAFLGHAVAQHSFALDDFVVETALRKTFAQYWLKQRIDDAQLRRRNVEWVEFLRSLDENNHSSFSWDDDSADPDYIP